MATVAPDEIVPGLVVYLDDEGLKQSGRCHCSAWLSDEKDHAIVSPHYFLVLEFVNDDAGWLLVPLSHNNAPNRGELNGELKSGYMDQWSKTASYYYQRQFWHVPADVIGSASQRDHSPRDDRRHYAHERSDELKTIVKFSLDNRNPFRLMQGG